jgi:hypothetical protein
MGFSVGDNYRTSELSLIPGGYTVCVRQTSGKVLEYDKIKKPYAYIRAASNNPNVMDAWIKS